MLQHSSEHQVQVAYTEEVQGVTNDTCIDITKEIEDTLGSIKNRKFKPQYYQKQNVTFHQHQNETQG